MIARILLSVLLVFAGVLAFGSAAYQEEVDEEVVEPTFYAPSTASSLLDGVVAYVVFSPADGEVLYEYNADTTLPIASITKLFAAMAIQDLLTLDESTTLEWSDLNAVGTAGQLQYGQEYTYRELLFPLLLSSSNNAALTFERRVRHRDQSLPEVMEELAINSGASNVQFADASGLSSGNQASARELARLITQTREDYPYIYDITRLESFLGPYLGWGNNSPYIADDAYRGGKHGYTSAAGRTAVALFSETVDDREIELGYIILGSTDLSRDMDTLRDSVQSLVEWR